MWQTLSTRCIWWLILLMQPSISVTGVLGLQVDLTTFFAASLQRLPPCCSWEGRLGLVQSRKGSRDPATLADALSSAAQRLQPSGECC